MKTKQDIIREGIKAILTSDFNVSVVAEGHALDSSDFPKAFDKAWSNRVDTIFSYLHSQGVVIKVEKELPFPMCTVRMNDPRYQDGAMIHAQKLMLEAGYVAVEPLIKEETNVFGNNQEG